MSVLSSPSGYVWDGPDEICLEACSYTGVYGALNYTMAGLEYDDWMNPLIDPKGGIQKALSVYGVINASVTGWFNATFTSVKGIRI